MMNDDINIAPIYFSGKQEGTMKLCTYVDHAFDINAQYLQHFLLQYCTKKIYKYYILVYIFWVTIDNDALFN
jgi:hypothetical protein